MSGCSGAGTGSAEAAPKQGSATTISTLPDSTVAAPVKPTDSPASRDSIDARPVIVCFGDSLTAGYGVEPALNYPADLQKSLDEAGYRYRVVNQGVSGDTTKDGLERVGVVLAKRPQIVVLEFGGNDGLRGLPIDGTKRNLAAMIAQLQRGGAKVALAGISLPPQYGQEYIAKFNAMYPALAKQYRVPLLPFLLVDVYGVDGDIQEDGIHPTAQGAKQVAANVQRLIEPLLRK
jgi:acyl-CoA thioesterase I